MQGGGANEAFWWGSWLVTSYLRDVLLVCCGSRFKPDNILVLELDLPERTTFDYDTAGMDRAQLQVWRMHNQ